LEKTRLDVVAGLSQRGERRNLKLKRLLFGSEVGDKRSSWGEGGDGRRETQRCFSG